MHYIFLFPKAFEQLVNLTHFYIHANNWNCFNLVQVMDILILQHGISYSIDQFDKDFPGTYINGIACMYRLPQSEELPSELKEGKDEVDFPDTSTVYYPLSEQSEVEKLRQEVKAVVQHFEQRVDMVYAMVNKLNEKMKSLEQMNSTLWNQVSIMV